MGQSSCHYIRFLCQTVELIDQCLYLLKYCKKKQTLKQAAIPPKILLTQEAEVAIVDVEIEVIAVAVECNDLALGVGCHPLEKYPFVMFHSLDAIFLCFTGELHLMESDNVVMLICLMLNIYLYIYCTFATSTFLWLSPALHCIVPIQKHKIYI